MELSKEALEQIADQLPIKRFLNEEKYLTVEYIDSNKESKLTLTSTDQNFSHDQLKEMVSIAKEISKEKIEKIEKEFESDIKILN